MKIQLKQFDTSLPVPAYQTVGAAGMDLYARQETTIAPKTIGYVPLNIALEIPEGYWVLVAARGSTHKQGLMPAHGIGIGDWDFRGDND
ncbi:MAG TPA: dUTP diphosphatase, partial [Verrucomicrobiae bacterium]|nr:dUTP diphosphatase [Verrucomicrobiae bacterium]